MNLKSKMIFPLKSVREVKHIFQGEDQLSIAYEATGARNGPNFLVITSFRAVGLPKTGCLTFPWNL